jgi:hypothetical protein
VSSTGVTTVGPATVRSVPTTEYRASIDLTRVGQLKDPAGRAALQKLASELHATSLPVTVWLDGQGRVAQESYKVSVPTSAGTTTTSATIGDYDFGSPMTISGPPAAQVYDITSQVVAAGGTTS